MRVLVTRAAADAARTAARLSARGHQALLAPVVAVVATGAAIPDDAFDVVLATSAHAFCGVVATPRLRAASLRVVGARTARAAQAAGFRPADVVAQTAAALSRTLTDDRAGGGRLLYLAGRDRKPDLEAAHAGALTVVETYAAQAVAALDEGALAALRAGAVDAALHFSARSAALFVERAAGCDLGRLRHVAISADAAAPLTTAGWAATIAAAPTEASLLDALDRIATLARNPL